MRRQLGWFAIAGVAGFAVDAGFLHLLLALGLDPYSGRLASFLLAVFVTWQINRRHTFVVRPDDALWREGLRYLGAMMLGGIVNYVVYSVLVVAGWKPILGLIGGTACGMTVNFLSARNWVFRPTFELPQSSLRVPLWERLNEVLSHPHAIVRAAWLAPVAVGLISLLLGQDSNWDLLNYHFYNPYALLNDRLSVDLAAAQLQSYFNPLLDIPYHLMVTHWPAMVAGFVMGAVHGINFVLLLCIAHIVLGEMNGGRQSTVILLALAGCLGPAFLSEIGSTMGDNSTAPFVLGAVAFILWQHRQVSDGGWGGALVVAAGGILIGLSVGLKLTNAVYAVALCLALMTLSVPWPRRVWVAFQFGSAVLVGIAVTSGYWFFAVWQTFGNPLFPQFNAWFDAPLAAPIARADTRWLPKSVWEVLAFPLIIAMDDRRVGELPMRPFIWTLVWGTLVLWGGLGVLRKRSLHLPVAARLVVVFVTLAFVTWMAVFSIYRYAVAMELLAPLVVWLVAHRIWSDQAAMRWAGVALTVVAVASVVTYRSWGHEPWSGQAFRVDLPKLQGSATILLIGGAEPKGWMAPFFPPQHAVVGLGTNFPEGPAFRSRVREIIVQRGGKAWGVLPAHSSDTSARTERLNTILSSLELSGSGWPCRGLATLLPRVSGRLRVDQSSPGGTCRIASVEGTRNDVDLGSARQSKRIVARYGLSLNVGSCRTFGAWVGSRHRPYQLCNVEFLSKQQENFQGRVDQSTSGRIPEGRNFRRPGFEHRERPN